MRSSALCLPALLAIACSSPAPTSLDAAVINSDGPAWDAAAPDAGAPDAFDPCPGETTFELGAVDWETGNNLPGVLVRESGTSNMATSAPNGRVVLCLSGTGPVNILFSKTNYLDRIHTTSSEAIAALYATGMPPTFRMLTPSWAEGLYSAEETSPSNQATTFIAMITNATTGAPLAGSTVAIDAVEDGAFTMVGPDLQAGTVTGLDGKVLFMNALLEGNTTGVSVTGPTSCEIPAAATLAAGVSSVAIACQP